MSSRLNSVEAFFTVSASVASETLMSLPFAVFPFFSLTASLLPAGTELSLAHSAVVPWARAGRVDSRNEVSKMMVGANLLVRLSIELSFGVEVGVDTHNKGQLSNAARDISARVSTLWREEQPVSVTDASRKLCLEFSTHPPL